MGEMSSLAAKNIKKYLRVQREARILYHAHELEELILLKYSNYLNQCTDSM